MEKVDQAASEVRVKMLWGVWRFGFALCDSRVLLYGLPLGEGEEEASGRGSQVFSVLNGANSYLDTSLELEGA